MFDWFRKIFNRQVVSPARKLSALPTISQRWRLIYIMGESKERIDLGIYEGSHDEALEECYGRQMVWFFKSGIRHAVFGTYYIEQIED